MKTRNLVFVTLLPMVLLVSAFTFVHKSSATMGEKIDRSMIVDKWWYLTKDNSIPTITRMFFDPKKGKMKIGMEGGGKWE